MTTATSTSSSARAELKGRTRFFAFADSDVLFLEKATTKSTLPVGVARKLSEVSQKAPDETVVLLNQNHQIEASVNLASTAELKLKNFPAISAIVVAPALGHELGTWRRRGTRSDGLCDVDFHPGVARDNATRAAFENVILRPWFADKRHSTVSYIDLYTLLQSREEYDRCLTKVYAKAFRVLGERVREGNISMDPRREHPDHMYGLLQALIGLGKVHYPEVSAELTAAAFKHRDLSPDAVEIYLPGRLDELEAATKQLEEISRKIDSATPEPESAPSKAAVSAGAERRSAHAADPVKNAIAIRQQLREKVRLVEPAEWAKWRDINSTNPSAALGKYKKQHRVFAVKAGRKDLYPSFQFSKDAEPLPVMRKVLAAVPKPSRGWPLLSWFSAKSRLLGGKTPAEVIADDPKSVLAAAERFYSSDG